MAWLICPMVRKRPLHLPASDDRLCRMRTEMCPLGVGSACQGTFAGGLQDRSPCRRYESPHVNPHVKRCRIRPYRNQGDACDACGVAGGPGSGSTLPRPPGPGRLTPRATRDSKLQSGLGRSRLLPRLPLSSSRSPRLGRPTDVASRWLRQPRPGGHSHGSGAYQEEGRKLASC